MAANDAMERLRAAGISVDQIPEPQRQVLSELSDEELDTLIRVQQKVSDAADVQGYARGDVGNIIF